MMTNRWGTNSSGGYVCLVKSCAADGEFQVHAVERRRHRRHHCNALRTHRSARGTGWTRLRYCIFVSLIRWRWRSFCIFWSCANGRLFRTVIVMMPFFEVSLFLPPPSLLHQRLSCDSARTLEYCWGLFRHLRTYWRHFDKWRGLLCTIRVLRDSRCHFAWISRNDLKSFSGDISQVILTSHQGFIEFFQFP